MFIFLRIHQGKANNFYQYFSVFRHNQISILSIIKYIKNKNVSDLRTEWQPAYELVLHPGYNALRVQAIALKYQYKFQLNLYKKAVQQHRPKTQKTQIKFDKKENFVSFFACM